MLRTHTCEELRKSDIGKDVVLSGWVNARRDHGQIIFIDLRDRYGITQIVFDPKISEKALRIANSIKQEFVIKVVGKVRERPNDMINNLLPTGKIEVFCLEVEILNKSKTPPFPINFQETASDGNVNEEIRLKYRFLDLRSKRLQRIMENRDKIITYIRKYFHSLKFIEIQTPILANSSPEGSRDYLVPSRIHPGKFYALPQAPQQFKQLLMISGFDRYFQIAPCFRDEDPRADRHAGDFYQIDIEMSFVEQEDVWNVVEPLMIELTEKFSEKKITSKPFPRITYKESINKYGTDKPDLRFDFHIENISEIFKETKCEIFEKALKKGGIICAVKVDNGGDFSRKEIEKLTETANKNGLGGLAYGVVKNNEYIKSPIEKLLSKDEKQKIIEKMKAAVGDMLFFGAGDKKTVLKSLGAVRSECGEKLGLKDPKKASWIWIYDFPMYEKNEAEGGRIEFSHNPFSMPQGGLSTLKNKNPLEVLAYQYDLVCNGFEISSGAIRNHRTDIMYKAFEIAGYKKEEVDAKFSHMINAFKYGAPPHGGFAPGLDRLLMILWDCQSIRDIYAFPKNSNAQDLMLGTPSKISDEQLKELHIKIE